MQRLGDGSVTQSVATSETPSAVFPTVKVTAPADGQTITTKTFTFRAEASQDASWIELAINGQIVKSDATQTISKTINVSPYKGRQITVSAVAKNPDGNSAAHSIKAIVRK